MCEKIETDVVRSRGSEEKFLIHVYDQMFATINRIHNSIWNMVVIIGGGIGVLKIYSECGYNHTFAFAIIVYITALSWILMRLYDFNYWCNRNLFIIKNIEDRFLSTDAGKIYGNFRPQDVNKKNDIRFTIALQIVFVYVVLIDTLCFYFCVSSSGFRTQMKSLTDFASVLWFGIAPFLPALIVYIRCKVKYKKGISSK